jgi:hypothetical protein
MVKWDYEDLDITPPMRVAEISSDEVMLQFGSVKHYAFVEDLQPIPITPEILKKNGFVEESEVGYERFEWRESGVAIILNCLMYSDRRIFTLTTSDLGVNGWLLRIEHVYQLQHAIRLAGIEKEIEV